MKCGVIIFPGSNCDHDTVHMLQTVYGLQTVELWHKDADLQGCDMIFVPGGFSYGDYLRCGAVARFSPIMEAVIKFANQGGFVMGICNGFQVLCEAHLLPGVLMRNANQKFICKNIYLRTETSDSAITAAIERGKVLKIPIAHAEGLYYADDNIIADLNKNHQILFRYSDANGNVNDATNPNGSLSNIAGICNATRNVFGMMPHPERAGEGILGNTDGKLIFDSIMQFASEKVA
ncbi:MAG: phosphoribosylformylglycinamidine synthase subunit PurQ [Bacteroidetes bacterium]|nr:phosphoribosylformylglycinamidine synthase subunit PurQ [Bacteroidota bacterium]